MASSPRIPTATYRLQLHRSFTFQDAARILPYLEKLGISDLYCSPFFRARPGSTHGYDVSNHNEFNPEIGARADFDRLVADLQARGMGQIVDFVPNHMGISDPSNEWWMDVLENGPSSTFGPFFDINWHPVKQQLHDKVLLPVLGEQYGRILEKGEFKLLFRDGAFFVTYHSWSFPLNPRTYHFILKKALQHLERYSDQDMYLELESILTALEYLPTRTETDEVRIKERAREKEVVKRRIARLCGETPQLEEAIDAAMRQIEGRVGRPESFNQLDELLNMQGYRLSYWRVAGEEINYRRFFDVNELAAIRVENPFVFDTIHQLVFSLLNSGTLTGLRIDHVDGLRDPKAYLETVQRTYQPSTPVTAASEREDARKLYLIVEKILSEGEKLRSDWPVHGTTGYEFACDMTQVLVDPSHADAFSRIYRDFIERYVHFDSLVYEKKRLVMGVSLASDIETLGHMLSELAERDRLHRDFTRDSLSTVVRDLIACFPVYRTYISQADGVSETDRQIITRAVRAAKRRNPAVDTSIFDFLRDVLLLENFDQAGQETKDRQLDFILKFQQCTGPIMAKGLEDTAFYIFNRLSALNEVGGTPQQFGITLEKFHEKNRARCSETPQSLLTLTTHDTKRSEDVRARIAVLSEIPEDWNLWLQNWRKINNKVEVDGEPSPSPNEEYLLYQTLLGTWPFTEAEINDQYVSRMQEYMLKAIKEAKVNSSWIQPNEDWEREVKAFVARILSPEHGFRASLTEAAKRVGWHGMLNSLTQTVLKLTSPGVPDFYQGTELWDFSLVDPDNRRPVDYELRQRLLDEIAQASGAELMSRWEDGAVKLFVTHRLLQLRRQQPDLFKFGNYKSLYAGGPLKHTCVAFQRRYGQATLLVIVPRLTTSLSPDKKAFDWGDAELLLDDKLPNMTNAFTGEKLALKSDAVPLKALNAFPFGVFCNAA